ncbi:conserved Plasmodium protein, unknown function [Plasmodium knowlesi strain H]|uniref:WD repeat-containing protein n=3 Tax=Plasmodium knowlesi TaxID=5850 RepID=A0A5K1USW3_PLAKH|nr:WD repeat-containing protein, putative [Plasmodium knowlesi strain H]OTN67067.1 Uncharacterized protein PKNOH_S07445200 [Plasmodium knowlesi]CAA9988579.1 WD repeat-containing protein, putative [Plasmodium knowlesi strain H]SBO21389.1 conserved Plasmodium protein, unknown function [Plasmodium knowlesi strain H]SBO21844.1 conserved Plasmodium protein, unknown function [Plasmodium knowlesi strain H]VVS78053.1 WD repeat-containing protein, putative [Plasmodium knowlesi strain H]|eukprot:XP_002259555.1 hypothetical protein, conserved in Plasmodium species [Plasmodium knowlesi strain H]
MRTASVNGLPTMPAGKNHAMVECRRICANHGVKAVCIIDGELVCVSFGNTIKIINITTVDVLLHFAASTSSNIYGLTFQRRSPNGGILIAHGVHKIYCYRLNISSNGKTCSLKLLSKYCTNKWILRAKFLVPTYEHTNERHNGANGKGTRAIKNNGNVILLCLSNGSVVLLHIYRGISLRKYKFRGIHLLYSADIFIDEKKEVYKIEVAGGTPFNKILLWNFKLRKNKKTVKFFLQKKIIPLEHFQELSGHRGIIFKVKYFQEHKYVGSVSDDREGRIWRRMRVKREREQPVMNTQNGNELIQRNFVRCYGQHHYKCVKVLTGHDARIWDIDMGMFNKEIYFMTCSEDSTCIVYEKGNAQNYFQFSNNNGSTVRCICFHAPLGVIISGSDNGTVHVKSLSCGGRRNRATTASSRGPRRGEKNASSTTAARPNGVVGPPEPKKCTHTSTEQITNDESVCRGGHSESKRNDDILMAGLKEVNRTGDEILSNVNQRAYTEQSNPCDQLPNDRSTQYARAKDLIEQNDSIHFVVDYLEEKLKQSNDWIRSVSHVNLYDIIISTNAGCIYIFKTKNPENIEVLLIYEEEKKNYFLTCLAFHGLDYICLGFSNGFCCFIFLKYENIQTELIKSDEQNKELTYFRCFNHRISEMCLVPLASVNYDRLISHGRYDNVEDVLHALVKKEVEGGGSDGGFSKSRHNNADPHTINSFYQIVYNHEADPCQYRRDNYHEMHSDSRVVHIDALLLAVFDHTGVIQIFSAQKSGHKMDVKKVAQTEIDVKNKKSKIISVNYLLKQRKKKMGIIFLVGDEYGCIFIIYVKTPIKHNSEEVIYDFANSFVKSKHKLRVHSNRKVFDIKIIDRFVYSCGQNGQVLKYQLYKDGNGMYTLYKLCLIKVGYYTSIYKLLPMPIRNYRAVYGGLNLELDKEVDYIGKVEHEYGEDIPGPANSKLQRNIAPTHGEEENTQNMFICCFKDKQFVLYDLKNKVEYLSVECGGFRRPLSMFTKFSPGFTKAFSFCFCKEKNIHFNLKTLCSTQKKATVPYEQIYINAGFHSKNVSCVLWVNKRYLCTCSEDGTIKIVHVNKWCPAKWKKKCFLNKGKTNTNCWNNMGGRWKEKLGAPFKDDKKDGRLSSSIIDDTEFPPRNKHYSPSIGASLKRSTHKNPPFRQSQINVLNHRMDIIQNVYNHSEPIFYMCFLDNPFHYFKRLKLLTSVGAKNSINIFYLYMGAQNTPIIYHVEKVRVQKFSSDLRFLSVQGNFSLLLSDGNKHRIRVDLLVGTSLGLILHYTGEYEFTHYENIIFCKVVQLAYLVCSYNLGSTILALNLTDIFLSDSFAPNGLHDGKGPLPSFFPQKIFLFGNSAEVEKRRCSCEQFEGHLRMPNDNGNSRVEAEQANGRKKEEKCEGAKSPQNNNVEEDALQQVSCGYENNVQEPTEKLFLNKRKGSKIFLGSILCCGLNNGEIHFYHFGKKLIPLMEKVKLHQNGINKICAKRKKDTIEIFTCGDDQSLNVLTLKICLPIENMINGEPNHIHVTVVQKRSFTNAHLSSIRSLVLFSNFVAGVSWDQYISIWKLRRNKNGKIFLKTEKKIKMAVYDVSCLNAYVIRKKEKPKMTLQNGVPPSHSVPIDKVRKGSRGSSTPAGSSRTKVYLTVAGSNGSLESFCLNFAT